MKKILIISATFYKHIADMLTDGAFVELKKAGYDYDLIEVPGVFEIPAAIAFAVESQKKNGQQIYDGYITLGCVIRGETTHYDYVCLESARGINKLAMKEKLAIGYGILTVENEQQALVRADKNQKNKGGFVASACLEMISLKGKFKI